MVPPPNSLRLYFGKAPLTVDFQAREKVSNIMEMVFRGWDNSTEKNLYTHTINQDFILLD
jgi:hypothetical protein